MTDVAIRVSGLGKRYRLGIAAPRYSTLRDSVRELAGASLRTLLRRTRRSKHSAVFWALKDITFEIRTGEIVGIIGRNGAGKSTLLKILSRITEPTEGEAELHGRIGSLLEVGSGFHPELTGRENVFLNGAILGMRRSEIITKFDEIAAFAEVDKFIDTPVKHYSSGMYMRLAFSVAAHLDPEILIVDEVLAVGDAEFQKKCLGKMGDVARHGRTVLFVSHNLHAVKSLCTRGIVLKEGKIDHDGPAAESVSNYLTSSDAQVRDLADNAKRFGSGEWRFTNASATKSIFDPAETLELSFRIEPTRRDASTAFLSALLVNEQGTSITQCDSRLVNAWIAGSTAVTGRLRLEKLWLKPGSYWIDLFICNQAGVVDLIERAVRFEVSPILPYPQCGTPDTIASSQVLSDFSWQTNQ